MKKTLPLIALALIVSVMFTADAESHRRCNDKDWTFNAKSIDFEDGTLVIEHEDEDWIVEITEDNELYIDGRKVRTNRQQRKLLRRYYRDFEDIEELAAEIAREGTKIGLAGAKLGVAAVACAVKLILEDYDCDDMEDEIDIKSDDIEKMARKLEKKAEKIEDMADDFEKTHKKLRRSIPELEDLEDF
jgi:hypothetical protein